MDNIKNQFTKRSIGLNQTDKNQSPKKDQNLTPQEKKLIAKLHNHRQKNYHPPHFKSRRSHSNTNDKRLKVIAIGGFEEVGKNCVAIEYEQDMILIDLGFQFPNKDMLGVDWVLPDITYVKKNIHKLRGIVISHGHLDHTGGLPYLLPQLKHVPVFATQLTCDLIKQRLEEFPDVTASLKPINPEQDKIKLGQFTIEFFRVNHNIPDSASVVVHTPEGTIVYSGDFKIDFTPASDDSADLQRIAAIGAQKVLLLLSESTNASEPGLTISEREIGENLDIAFSRCQGRIIIATFSLLLSRIQQIINSAHKLGRKVTFLGRSMLQNFEIATKLKYYKIPRGILISPKEINRYPDNQIVVIATGSQGQESSAIGRMSLGEHRFMKIKKGDTVILSSSPIPGNEKSIYDMIDNLIRQGAKVIDDKSMDIHASGHGSITDLKLLITLLKPKYLLPDHGSLHMRAAHAQIGQDLGMPEENTILLDNGQIAEFHRGQLVSTKTKVPSGLVFVDGLGVGDVGNIVIRDRQQLAGDGIIVIIAQIKKENSPSEENNIDIISRGFVYMKSADALMKELKKKALNIVNHRGETGHIDLTNIRNRLRDDIGSFVFDRTQRRPMIIPVTIEV